MKWLLVPLLLTGLALAANPQDEQVVRTAYAKLAYAVQSRTVYMEVQKKPDLTLPELAKQLQANELRFEISDMSSGSLSDISSRPYSDFVSRPERGQDVLQISSDTETFDENGKRATSTFANPHWVPSHDAGQEQSIWDTPVKTALTMAGHEGKFSRYVTATITVRYQERSRTYHTLWLFGGEILSVDLVSGMNIPSQFVSENLFPSVLTDTSLRSRAAVNGWLNSTQRFEASCKGGKQDVCCDSAMHCGVFADDLRTTKPAPNAMATPKEKLQ